MRYEIINLDVWGNEKDGYEVNDAHYTGEFVEIEDINNDSEILKAVEFFLIDPKNNCYVDNISSETNIYINDNRDDLPLIELQLVQE